VGDYIHVLYDGIMTRSLPAQVYAQKIGCYKTTGTVSELTESGFLLTTETDVVQVNADAALLDGMENGTCRCRRCCGQIRALRRATSSKARASIFRRTDRKRRSAGFLPC